MNRTRSWLFSTAVRRTLLVALTVFVAMLATSLICLAVYLFVVATAMIGAGIIFVGEQAVLAGALCLAAAAFSVLLSLGLYMAVPWIWTAVADRRHRLSMTPACRAEMLIHTAACAGEPFYSGQCATLHGPGLDVDVTLLLPGQSQIAPGQDVIVGLGFLPGRQHPAGLCEGGRFSLLNCRGQFIGQGVVTRLVEGLPLSNSCSGEKRCMAHLSREDGQYGVGADWRDTGSVVRFLSHVIVGFRFAWPAARAASFLSYLDCGDKRAKHRVSLGDFRCDLLSIECCR